MGVKELALLARRIVRQPVRFLQLLPVHLGRSANVRLAEPRGQVQILVQFGAVGRGRLLSIFGSGASSVIVVGRCVIGVLSRPEKRSLVVGQILLLELRYDGAELGDRVAAGKLLPQGGIRFQMMKQLEQMPADVRYWGRVLLDQIQILVRHAPGGRIHALEQGRIVQVALRRHHPVDARLGDAPLDVVHRHDVAVREDRYAQLLPQHPHILPVGQPGQRALLVAGPPVHGQHLGAGVLQHSGLPFVLQEGTVVAALGDGLRAAEIDIDRVAVILGEQGRLQHYLRIVAAELKSKAKKETASVFRPVFRAGLQRVLPILRILGEAAAVEHGRVAELCAVPAAQQPPGQLASVHHRCHDVPRRTEHLFVELKPAELTVRLPRGVAGCVHRRCRCYSGGGGWWFRRQINVTLVARYHRYRSMVH
uniref:Uncharacterized protein n=1 Tax=Anopheles merus TaxID=30066 RepID=A0A182V848_ANOME